MSEAAAPAAPSATIVTQTRVDSGRAQEFARWQEGIGAAVARFPGFLEQTVMPPSPPAQVDWVVLQRFASAEAALAWLNSDQRATLLQEALPMLVGQDDVHIVKDGAAGVLPAPVSAVISTRIRPGSAHDYRAWEQRIAAAQARARGFQGYRFEPPIPGVQEDWLAILRFDSDTNLQAWLASPDRLRLLEEARPFTLEVHARIVRTGFDQWFQAGAGAPAVPAWKQNMLVLLMLYPVVFLFGALVQTPLLMGAIGMPFWLALFLGNVASVALLNFLVPWAGRRFAWWLQGPAAGRADLAGALIVTCLYALCLLAFSRYP
jgi:antibiotic biosynthesis monooxygenase (ABM) superfamily enzyme